MVEEKTLKFPLMIQDDDACNDPSICNDQEELVKYLSEEGFEFAESDNLDGYKIWPLITEGGRYRLNDEIWGDRIKIKSTYSFKVGL